MQDSKKSGMLMGKSGKTGGDWSEGCLLGLFITFHTLLFFTRIHNHHGYPAKTRILAVAFLTEYTDKNSIHSVIC